MDDPKDTPLDEWIARCRKLELENRRLRALLAKLGIDSPAPVADLLPSKPTPAAKPANSGLNTAQKIALFRILFRGREDVYAQRWESSDGRAGYSPRTERDWKSYYAAKPDDRKRVDKENRYIQTPNIDRLAAEGTGRAGEGGKYFRKFWTPSSRKSGAAPKQGQDTTQSIGERQQHDHSRRSIGGLFFQ